MHERGEPVAGTPSIRPDRTSDLSCYRLGCRVSQLNREIAALTGPGFATGPAQLNPTPALLSQCRRDRTLPRDLVASRIMALALLLRSVRGEKLIEGNWQPIWAAEGGVGSIGRWIHH